MADGSLDTNQIAMFIKWGFCTVTVRSAVAMATSVLKVVWVCGAIRPAVIMIAATIRAINSDLTTIRIVMRYTSPQDMQAGFLVNFCC